MTYPDEQLLFSLVMVQFHVDFIHKATTSRDGFHPGSTVHNDTRRSTTIVVFRTLRIFPMEATDIIDLQIETEIVVMK